jgi:hypothetical protein
LDSSPRIFRKQIASIPHPLHQRRHMPAADDGAFNGEAEHAESQLIALRGASGAGID